jgi:hypothetical protein
MCQPTSEQLQVLRQTMTNREIEKLLQFISELIRTGRLQIENDLEGMALMTRYLTTR